MGRQMGSDGSSTQVEARPQNPRLRWQDCLLISIHWSPYICSRFESFETGLMSMILMRTCSPSCVSGIYKAVSYVFFFFFFPLECCAFSDAHLQPRPRAWLHEVVGTRHVFNACCTPLRVSPMVLPHSGYVCAGGVVHIVISSCVGCFSGVFR